MGSVISEKTDSYVVLVYLQYQRETNLVYFFPQMMGIRKLEMLISIIPIMKKEMNILIKTWHSLR